MIKVSLCEAIELCNKLYLQLERFGYFPALTGGQLYKTGGRKDIDIVIYRHRQKVANFEMKDIKSNLEEIVEAGCAHMFLDGRGVLRHEAHTQTEYSLIGRIKLYKYRSRG